VSMPYGGHEAKLYYVEETTYGVTPATPAMHGIGSVISVDPILNPSNIKVRGTGSRDLQFIKRGLRQADLKVNYHPHTLFMADLTLLNSYSIEIVYEKASGIFALLYQGCRINNVTAECSVEDCLKMTTDFIGRNAGILTTKVGQSYTDHEAAIPFYESYVKKNTVTLERVTDFKFEIANNLKRIPVIRGQDGYMLKYLTARHRDLSGEVTFNFETDEEFDDAINDNEFSLEFGLGGTNKANFVGCKWQNVSTPTRIEDLVALKAPFVAKGPVSIS